MTGCEISSKKQDLYLKQMKHLNCHFLFVKYIPAVMVLKNFILQKLRSEIIIDDTVIYNAAFALLYPETHGKIIYFNQV